MTRYRASIIYRNCRRKLGIDSVTFTIIRSQQMHMNTCCYDPNTHAIRVGSHPLAQGAEARCGWLMTHPCFWLHDTLGCRLLLS
jgi:hypothetical protein